MKLSKFSKHVSRLTNEYSTVRVKEIDHVVLREHGTNRKDVPKVKTCNLIFMSGGEICSNWFIIT